MPNDSVNYQDLEHAVRLVSSGCATLEEASRISGISLATLQARTSASKTVGANTRSSPTNTAVYKRSAKGVLTITRQSRNITSVAKDLFFSIDGRATAADLAARSKANTAYVYATLKTWEREGLIEILRGVPTAHESTIDNAVEESDLDFTREQGPAHMAMLRSDTPEPAEAETATRPDTVVVPKSEWLEVKIEPTSTALKEAQERVSHISSQLNSERQSRQEILQALNEARTQADRQRSIAEAQVKMLAQVQDELAAARRAHEAQRAQHSARNEAQARMLSEANMQRKALEADLVKARTERECAIRLLAETPYASAK